MRFNRSKSLALHAVRSRSITSDTGEDAEGLEPSADCIFSQTNVNSLSENQEAPPAESKLREDSSTLIPDVKEAENCQSNEKKKENEEEETDRLFIHLRDNMEAISEFCRDIMQQIPIPEQCVIEGPGHLQVQLDEVRFFDLFGYRGGGVALLHPESSSCLHHEPESSSCLHHSLSLHHVFIMSLSLHHVFIMSLSLHHVFTTSLSLHHVFTTSLSLHHVFIMSLSLDHVFIMSLSLHHVFTTSLSLHHVFIMSLSLHHVFTTSLSLHHVFITSLSLHHVFIISLSLHLVNQEGQPLIEGKLKEKQKDELDDMPIELSKVQSVKVVAKKRRDRGLPRAFEIFTDSKTYVLKAHDEKHAEEWLQCINVAVAQARERENREATTYL
ncbi:hypothetical protein F7725_021035 [Dissostichus mawsoni]|uniref:PH domain-containing protein n=1 Tax=Dissostichus mawsoni TaxID=36200 RepID=A0A7J5YHM6_DISMA|nr:hypothetical protein F7725_021035 [Dissostichus mawsoni]